MEVNPYWNKDFFESTILLLKRAVLWISGNLPTDMLVEDDVAFMALVGVGFSCVFSGVFLVVKRMTLVVNALSHTILLGIVASALILVSQGMSPFSTTGFILAAFLASFITMASTNVLVKIFRVQPEAAIGFMFTTLFAIGVLFSTLFFRNTHLGVEAIFGNLDAVEQSDLLQIFFVTGLNFLWMFLFFGRLRFIYFDGSFAKVMGQKTFWMDAAKFFITALTIVGGFQSVGVVIIMAFFTLPILIARLFGPFLKKILIIGCGVTLVSALVSVAIARDILTHYATAVSTGAVSALVLFIAYIVLGLTYFKKAGKLEHS